VLEPIPTPDPAALVGLVQLEEPEFLAAVDRAAITNVTERWAVLSREHAWHCFTVGQTLSAAGFDTARAAVESAARARGYEVRNDVDRLYADRSENPAPWVDNVSFFLAGSYAPLDLCIVHPASSARAPMVDLMIAEPVFAHARAVLADPSLVELHKLDLRCDEDGVELSIRGGIHPGQVEPVERWLVQRGYCDGTAGIAQREHENGMQSLCRVSRELYEGKYDVELILLLPQYGDCPSMLASL
jgi:hypothetical protein